MHSNTSSVRSGRPGMDTQGSANARPQQSRRETHETTDPTYSGYPAPQTGPGWGSGHYGYPPPRATPWTPMPASGAYQIPQAPYSALSNPVQAPPPEPLFVAVNPFDVSSPRWRRPGRQAPQNSVTSAEMPPSWPMQSPPPMHAFQPFALIPPVVPEGPSWSAGAVPARHSRSRSRGQSPTRIPHMVPESRHSRSPPRGRSPVIIEPERFLDLYGVEEDSETDSFVSASIAESREDLHAHSPGRASRRQSRSPRSEAHSSKSSSRAGRRCAGRSRSKSRSRTRSRSPSIHRRPTSRRADRNHSRSPRRSRSPRSHPPSVRRRPSSRDGRWGGRSQARPHHYPRSRSPPVRSTVEQGVGRHEAQHWHRHAYGGHGEFGQMQPAEIGHAAAYEAYRISIHASSMYEPLSGDIEKQRENLIGLAVAEASRLLQFANRSMDKNARTVASESAAATASILFYGSNPHRTFRVPSRGHSPQIVPVIQLPSQIPTTALHPYYAPEKLPDEESLPLPNTGRARRRRQTFPSTVLMLLTIMSTTFFVLFDFVPRQVYLHFLLRIPSLYFSRVARIFEDARLSLPDIKRMARAKAEQWNATNPPAFPSLTMPDQMPLPQTLLHFRATWEGFIDSLMREWQTLNIISVLLMSAILTMLQIEAASHPITRTSALFSLICALMSLLYGCMYIVRFGGMRKMHKASSFAEEAQKGTTSIWWNVWVLLAMPAVWLAWSIIMFFTCIMSFIWLSGSSQDPVDFAVSPRVLLGLRIALTLVFALGIIYFVLIVRTFHRYGDPLDREWRRRVDEWTKEMDPYPYYQQQQPQQIQPPIIIQQQPPIIIQSTSHPSRRTPDSRGTPPPFGVKAFTTVDPSPPLTTHPSAFFKKDGGTRLIPPVHPITLMKLGNHTDVQAAPVAGDDDLRRFMLDVSSAWNGQLALTPPDEDGASTNILPVYTLLPPAPAHPKPPVNPTSDPDSARDPPRNRARSMSTSSSISSFHGGRPQPQPSSTLSMSTPAVPASVFIPETTAASGTGHAFVSAPSPDDAEKSNPPVPVPPPPSSPLDTVQAFIRLWNERYFHPRELEARVVPEGSFAEFAVKLVSRPRATNHDNSHDPRSDTKESNDPGASWSTWQEEEEGEQ